ncbi:endonuclease/exonuclease/phosphatase family protein [Jatrophihabitans endophyticus]|uniref:endonuclease/exonuclease/phosphatase family protein n=1 Tax=Jatrophihabitans endophyticus TaxID=1206085 RepID=UPI0019DDA2B9|nr:endonuclease/exonuclease/phosphatase family protein [Jatrophihabitans endophyticus]MBE7189409.1 endonuclease/exonuclease/phosphatase family protein [Jatrophihabitans endophyticus]
MRTHSSRRRRALTAAAVVAGLLVAAGVAVPASAASTKQVELHVVQWNIEGGHDTRLQQIPNLAKGLAHRPDVLFIEEVCRSEVQQMHRLAYFKGWHFVYKTSQQSKPGTCAKATGISHPYQQGQVVASPHAMSAQHNYRLPGRTHKGEASAHGTPSPQRQFWLTCTNLAFSGVRGGSLRACGTHLRPGFNEPYEAPERLDETNAIRSITNGFRAQGQQVVLGGDFNTTPTGAAMNPIYQLDDKGTDHGAGHFVEADQNDKTYFGHDSACTSRYHCRSGEGTQIATPNKIDYVFYTAGATGVGGGRGPALNSDHYRLVSTAFLKLPRS